MPGTEVQIINLKLPSCSDFSKLKCVVSIGANSQSTTYPFKPLSFYSIDDLGLMTIAITSADKPIGGVDIPLAIFQKKKQNTFKLSESLGASDRKKPSSARTKAEVPEITLFLKPIYSVEESKTLEKKLEETVEMLDESYRSRKDLQLSIEETTAQLSEMINTQDEIIKKYLEEKNCMQEICSDLEFQLAEEKTKTSSYETKIEELESTVENLKSIEKQLKNAEDWGKEIKSQSDKYLEQQDELIEKIKNSSEDFKVKCDDYQGKLESLAKEKIGLLKDKENLVRENYSLKEENELISDELLKCKARIAQLEAETIQHAMIKRREGEFNEKLKASENLVASLKDELAKINALYKENIAKTSNSKNQMAVENKETIDKLEASEKNLASKKKENEKLQHENSKLLADMACLEQHLCNKEDSNQIIDDLNKNIQNSRIENKEITEKLNEQSEKIKDKDKAIEDLENNLKEKTEEIEVLMSAVMKLQKNKELYVPVPNDPIDSALADYINTLETPLVVPFTREEEGIYLFGTKRIFVKLEQGKIIIRVGGGFMLVSEFIEVYTNAEVEKFARQQSDKAQMVRMSLFGKLGEESPGKFNTCYGIQKKPSNSRQSSSPRVHNSSSKDFS